MPRILLVEDNAMSREMMRRALSRAGHEVETAADGLSAVTRALAEPRPDLVLMDLSLPELDGWEATRRIRAAESSRVPIIALTAHALTEDRDRALAAGCDAYDTKPVDLPGLFARIQAMLEGIDGSSAS